MKNLSYISSLLLLVLFLASCGKDGGDPTPSAATFRVDFAQSGDYEKFNVLLTISGGEFKYRGTNDVMPAVILGDDLGATFSVEAPNVEELEISTITGFSPVENGPASMSMKFTIYRNGIQVDEKTYTYNETTRDKSEDLSYKAN